MIGASPHTGEPYFFENNQSNRTTDMGENVPPKTSFLAVIPPVGVFGGKNLKAVFGTPFPIEKVVPIFVIQHPIP